MKIIVMKIILFSVMMILLLAGCAESAPGDSGEDNVHTLDERFFGTQILEIFQNQDDFLGRTIRYEGIFSNFDMLTESVFIVYRYEDGCCGPEPVGLEVFLDDIAPFPDDTWVEVTGVLSRFERGGQIGMRLNVTSLIETTD